MKQTFKFNPVSTNLKQKVKALVYRIFLYKIKPLLEEYFYGDEQGLKSVMRIVKYDGDDNTE